MKIFQKQNDLKNLLKDFKAKKQSIGFIPTMGALHEGHLALIKKSGEDNDITIASIFVNPTQFNNAGDYEKYPITIDADIEKLVKAECQILFLPAEKEMYPPGQVREHYQLGYLENILEGKFRPGHYQGVATIVHKLLSLVEPHRLYLGQKDYQQIMVIKKLIADKGFATEAVIVPTKREASGLAMSSRNVRLKADERIMAINISQQLLNISNIIEPGNTNDLITRIEKNLENCGLKTEYVSLNSAATLQPLVVWDGKEKIIALAAAHAGEVRLIDNVLIN